MKENTMPKFCVTLLREVWDKARVVVDAANSEAAEAAALALTETDETMEWVYDQTPAIDAVDVKEVPETTAESEP
jgi:hypothetical protein